MILLKITFFFAAFGVFDFLFPGGAWAWGPGVHTVIATGLLGDLQSLLPLVAENIRAYPLEFLYGNLAADFFVGKGIKPREGHSHNWETGFRLMKEARGEREASYAYGFLSHLAADVIAHNYFIPIMIQKTSSWGRMGHLYWETASDCFVGPVYTKIAKEILSMEQLGCDELLISAVGKKKGLRARRRIFTQSVKLSDYLSGSPPRFLINRGLRRELFPVFLASMISLSYRSAKDVLLRPDGAPCLTRDPIGSRNLLLAGKRAFRRRLFGSPRRSRRFEIDGELLSL
ncbi:MAG: zinc dependent phospholipase C family protein [Deltaproteobacteria bacterium]|nr:zinc dependent phospholipase C family protein [Deltaproteobacteria bacterium]MBW2129512.1 zinc dependent phospholipase C family protein [Deltaproteobacteria bacterium]MBW2304718.1 zinc dependent phospholipase C family protein [Deltaproteobacteria bacterium]